MYHLKILQIILTVGTLSIIDKFSEINGELTISPLPNSSCVLEEYNKYGIWNYANENKIENTLGSTIYENMSRTCDLQINASSSSEIGISVVAGNITGLDYIYVERIGSVDSVCSERFVAFMGPLEQHCTVYFPSDTIQLHFRGRAMTLYIYKILRLKKIILFYVLKMLTRRMR